MPARRDDDVCTRKRTAGKPTLSHDDNDRGGGAQKLIRIPAKLGDSSGLHR